jgi:hypothetical protein
MYAHRKSANNLRMIRIPVQRITVAA